MTNDKGKQYTESNKEEKMKPDRQGKNSDKVGKGQPPKDTRWKPGQSGNPKGRPKGIKYMSEMLREQLDEVPETIDGKKNTKTWRWAGRERPHKKYDLYGIDNKEKLSW